MSSDDTALAKLAGAILDGTPIDWDAVDSAATPGPPARASPESDRGDRRCSAQECPRCGDRCGCSNGSGTERSATCIERGTRGSIARSRSSCCRPGSRCLATGSRPRSSKKAGCSPAYSPQRRHHLWRRAHRRPRWPVDGICRRRERCIRWWSTTASSSRRGRPPRLDRHCLQRGRSRPCRRPAPSRHQGAERHDGRRGPGGVDGFRHRA